MKLTSILRGMVYGFKREERGSIAVEAVVILPMMFWTYLALFASFHSYRTYAVNQKAAYTIGDMISREISPLDQDYVDGSREMLRYLTNGQQNATSVRVTVVQYDLANNRYDREWSEASGPAGPASAATVRGWADQLPVMPDDERVVVVETFTEYDPPFNTGMVNRDVRNFVFTRPRYSPQICWETCDTL